LQIVETEIENLYKLCIPYPAKYHVTLNRHDIIEVLNSLTRKTVV